METQTIAVGNLSLVVDLLDKLYNFTSDDFFNSEIAESLRSLGVTKQFLHKRFIQEFEKKCGKVDQIESIPREFCDYMETLAGDYDYCNWIWDVLPALVKQCAYGMLDFALRNNENDEFITKLIRYETPKGEMFLFYAMKDVFEDGFEKRFARLVKPHFEELFPKLLKQFSTQFLNLNTALDRLTATAINFSRVAELMEQESTFTLCALHTNQKAFPFHRLPKDLYVKEIVQPTVKTYSFTRQAFNSVFVDLLDQASVHPDRSLHANLEEVLNDIFPVPAKRARGEEQDMAQPSKKIRVD